jgi:hypothetical protein
MPPKKKINEDKIIDLYMDYYLENGEAPKSVYHFAKVNNFEEKDFYQFFGSFEAIDNYVFKAFFDQTVKLLETSEEYGTFDPRNKLLSFYFTYFELLTANRSFVLSILDNGDPSMKSLRVLRELRSAFTEYIAELEIETLDLKEEKLEKLKDKSLKESSWTQFLVTLKFWMEDSSAGFEKTDMFIEKSVNTGFDLLDVTPLKSVLDFGKFLFKEKIQMK